MSNPIWRPPSFENFHRQIQSNPAGASRDLDQAFQLAFKQITNNSQALQNTVYGNTVLTGSQLAVPTGLAVVTQTTGSIDFGTNAHNYTLSVRPSATDGCIDIFVWQPTSSGNNTPIPATVSVTVRWVATGTK